MKHLKELQKEYARLVISEGVSLQKGQRLVINCPVEGAFFARLCAEAAYEAGCKDVLMRWSDDTITKYHYLYADEEVFDEPYEWDTLMLDTVSAEGAAWLSIAATDPENLKDAEPDRIRRAQISRGKALENFRKREMNNDFSWCVCSIPTAAWAKAVFPDLETEIWCCQDGIINGHTGGTFYYKREIQPFWKRTDINVLSCYFSLWERPY